MLSHNTLNSNNYNPYLIFKFQVNLYIENLILERNLFIKNVCNTTYLCLINNQPYTKSSAFLKIYLKINCIYCKDFKLMP